MTTTMEDAITDLLARAEREQWTPTLLKIPAWFLGAAEQQDGRTYTHWDGLLLEAHEQDTVALHCAEGCWEVEVWPAVAGELQLASEKTP